MTHPAPWSADEPSDEDVREALASRDLDALAELSDRLWHRLPASYAPELLDVLADAPDGEVESRPRLLLAGLVAHDVEHPKSGAPMRAALQALRTHGRRYARSGKVFRRREDVLAAGVCAVVSARLRGAYTEAGLVAERLERQLDAHESPDPGPWSRTRTRARPGLLSLQQGLTAMLSGAFDVAVSHLTRADTEAGSGPNQHFAGVEASAVLAMLMALKGHHGLARTWLQRHDEYGAVPDPLRRTLSRGAAVAEALLAIDDVDQAGAEHWLATAGTAGDAGELWPFVAALRADYDLLFDHPRRGLQRLEEACFAHGIRSDRCDMAGHVVIRARADLLAQLGEGTQVVHLAETHPRAVNLLLPTAHVFLRSNDNLRAVRLAARAVRHPGVTPRDAAGLRLILAAAHLRLGEPEKALIACDDAALGGTNRRYRRSLAFLPLEDRHALAALGAITMSETLPSLDTNPPDMSLVQLTPRESVILYALAGRQTVPDIARSLGVSPHTVRTQVRSTYAKLEAHSRSEALARAAQLGLIARPEDRGAVDNH